MDPRLSGRQYFLKSRPVCASAELIGVSESDERGPALKPRGASAAHGTATAGQALASAAAEKAWSVERLLWVRVFRVMRGRPRAESATNEVGWGEGRNIWNHFAYALGRGERGRGTGRLGGGHGTVARLRRRWSARARARRFGPLARPQVERARARRIGPLACALRRGGARRIGPPACALRRGGARLRRDAPK